MSLWLGRRSCRDLALPEHYSSTGDESPADGEQGRWQRHDRRNSRSSQPCGSIVKHEPTLGSRAVANGGKTAEVCHRLGFRGPTFRACKAKVGVMKPPKAKQLMARDQ